MKPRLVEKKKENDEETTLDGESAERVFENDEEQTNNEKSVETENDTKNLTVV